jgi:hypothetical protein
MRRISITTLFLIVAFQISTIADTTIVNTTMGISAYLPSNWIATQVSDSHVTFNDTTFTYNSQIVIKKHNINVTDYPSATNWTRAHFIAYLMVVQYSYDPFGAILYFDSTSNSQQDSLWAPEAFSEFYTIDTSLGSWNEYMSFTESGSCGYELYAIGDTTDMKQNIGTYMAIIRLIQIENKSSQITIANKIPLRKTIVPAQNTISPSVIYNLMGKRCLSVTNGPNGIYYKPSAASLQIKVK